MDWLVFGDDWGAHPSTIQHLVKNLPRRDRVIWVDSIGMRQPRLSRKDLDRLWAKFRRFWQPGAPAPSVGVGAGERIFRQLKPKVLPFHLNRPAVALNKLLLGRSIRDLGQSLGFEAPVMLTFNPVVAQYLDAFEHQKIVYLRLDDFARLPGVDLALVEHTEQLMFERAHVIFATARALLPNGPWAAKSHYLPQAVDWAHFAQIPLTPPSTRVLGFFGLIAEWIDFELVEAVARGAPQWQLEFVGPVRYLPPRLRSLPNLRMLPPVPYAELPRALAGWSAAWIPFELSELTLAVNPLKVREYLAAGLPTHCTPLPEVVELAQVADIIITNQAPEVLRWLAEVAAGDSLPKRQARRQSVEAESWASRCAEMRQRIGAG